MVLLDVAVAATFVWCITRTISAASVEQRPFLKLLRVLYGSYLLVMPVIVVLAADALSPWVRQYWIRAIELLAAFGSNASLLWLIWPTRAEKHFLHFGAFTPAGGDGQRQDSEHRFEEVVSVETEPALGGERAAMAASV